MPTELHWTTRIFLLVWASVAIWYGGPFAVVALVLLAKHLSPFLLAALALAAPYFIVTRLVDAIWPKKEEL